MIGVILSGGAGTRLWPVSRELYPKPFMKLPDGQSLLQKTLARAVNLGISRILTVTGQEYFYATLNEYRSLDLSNIQMDFILEPLRRNTAPAIALAALWVEAHHPNETMLVLSSDQLIQNEMAFMQAVKQAESIASEGYLATFGIQPTYPATGFGYIQQGSSLSDGAYEVARFVEKPDLETAEAYLQSGQYHWNAGIFCFQAKRYLEALQTHAPDIYKTVKECYPKTSNQEALFIDADSFRRVPSESVDYAVMEKAEQVAVVPGNFGWSDLGSWDATAQLVPPDSQGNRVFGEALLMDCQNTFIQSEDRVVALIGIKDLVIVDTHDALLVSQKDRVQDVKKVVEQLQQSQNDIVRKHRTVQRPWGSYTTLEESTGFRIRKVEIRPGQAISKHAHRQRSEHWAILSGVAQAEIDGQIKSLHPNQSISVSADSFHQISNPGLVDLVLIEIQSGDYLGEDDVVRFAVDKA